MRICLLGDFSDDLDEGYKNYSHTLARELEKYDHVIRLNIKRIPASIFWHDFRYGKPDVLHTISQPTKASLIFTRYLKFAAPNAKTVVSALRIENYFRKNNKFSEQFLRALSPDMILVQGNSFVNRLTAMGLRAANLPGGVDLERFQPCDKDRRIHLRQKFGVDTNQPVVLHVGHLISSRNILILSQLIPRGIQVVVVGSTYLGIDQGLVSQLTRAGVMVHIGYQPKIEEFYQMADCYVFPVEPGKSLSTPLSVLEAMATNLPVVTTRFLGLVDMFPKGDGLEYANSPDEIVQAIMKLYPFGGPVKNREKTASLSWDAIVKKLRNIYVDIVEQS